MGATAPIGYYGLASPRVPQTDNREAVTSGNCMKRRGRKLFYPGYASRFPAVVYPSDLT